MRIRSVREVRRVVNQSSEKQRILSSLTQSLHQSLNDFNLISHFTNTQYVKHSLKVQPESEFESREKGNGVSHIT